MNQSNSHPPQNHHSSESTTSQRLAHDPNTETHEILVRLVAEQYQAADYKLEPAEKKIPRDFYGKALLEVGFGENRKAYFKLEGKQRIPTIIVLNGHQLAKWEIVAGRRYRVYVPALPHSATLREENK